MSRSIPQFRPWLALLQEHFGKERYSRGAAHNQHASNKAHNKYSQI